MALSSKLRPLGDRVLVKRVDGATKTPGGLYIPDNAKEKPMEGLVHAVGPGKVTDAGRVLEPHVKTGDRVLFGKYSGSEVKVDGEDYVLMREEDILGIVDG